MLQRKNVIWIFNRELLCIIYRFQSNCNWQPALWWKTLKLIYSQRIWNSNFQIAAEYLWWLDLTSRKETEQKSSSPHTQPSIINSNSNNDHFPHLAIWFILLEKAPHTHGIIPRARGNNSKITAGVIKAHYINPPSWLNVKQWDKFSMQSSPREMHIISKAREWVCVRLASIIHTI